MSFQWLGFVGTALVVVAYVPQLGHLIRARCTAGVSLLAYAGWSVSSILLFVYAITVGDPVFIALQSYQLAATAAILLLSRKSSGRLCELHCGTESAPVPRPGTLTRT